MDLENPLLLQLPHRLDPPRRAADDVGSRPVGRLGSGCTDRDRVKSTIVAFPRDKPGKGKTPYQSMLPMGTLACLEVKMIGKPYALCGLGTYVALSP